MKTRLANKFDQPEVIRLLKEFQKNTPIPEMALIDDEEYISKFFHHILIGGGVAIVAERAPGQLAGMIVSLKASNIWDPKRIFLKELAYYVDIDQRNTTAAYRLIKHYNEYSEQLIKENKIFCYTLTKMVNSPDLKFDRFGYRKIEETWVGGI